MRRCVQLCWFLFAVLLGCGEGQPAHYGSAVSGENVRSFEDVRTVPEGETLVVEGRVIEVCPHAGCWFVLSDGRDTLYIDLLQGIEFTVPKDLRDQWVRVVGEARGQGAERKLVGRGVAIREEEP